MVGIVVNSFFDDIWNTEDDFNRKEIINSPSFEQPSDHSNLVIFNKIWVIGDHAISQGIESEETVDDISYITDGEISSNEPFIWDSEAHIVTVLRNKIWGVGSSSGDSDP